VEVSRIITEIDAQISKLQQARALLSGTAVPAAAQDPAPKGSKNTATATGPRKRKLSPEGRKRIADAMKKRWASAGSRTQRANNSDSQRKKRKRCELQVLALAFFYASLYR